MPHGCPSAYRHLQRGEGLFAPDTAPPAIPERRSGEIRFDPITVWHTAWFEATRRVHIHTLEVDMAPCTRFAAGFATSGSGAPDGPIEDWRFFVSVDGVDGGEPAVSGSLDNITDERAAALGPAPSQRASPPKATSAAREARARRAAAV